MELGCLIGGARHVRKGCATVVRPEEAGDACTFGMSRIARFCMEGWRVGEG